MLKVYFIVSIISCLIKFGGLIEIEWVNLIVLISIPIIIIFFKGFIKLAKQQKQLDRNER